MKMSWSSDELTRIAAADELHIQALQADGTLRKPTPIWVVREGDDIYVRAYRGRGGTWYRSTQLRREGHVSSGGVDKDVTFVPETDQAVNDRIDAGYRAKYQSYGPRYVDPMVTGQAREATLKLIPR